MHIDTYKLSLFYASCFLIRLCQFIHHQSPLSCPLLSFRRCCVILLQKTRSIKGFALRDDKHSGFPIKEFEDYFEIVSRLCLLQLTAIVFLKKGHGRIRLEKFSLESIYTFPTTKLKRGHNTPMEDDMRQFNCKPMITILVKRISDQDLHLGVHNRKITKEAKAFTVYGFPIKTFENDTRREWIKTVPLVHISLYPTGRNSVRSHGLTPH